MPRSVQDILDHDDDLAQRFEDYEPHPDDERDPQAFVALRRAASSRADAERSIIAAITQARESGYSWRTIGRLLGTSGEAARQRYSSRAA